MYVSADTVGGSSFTLTNLRNISDVSQLRGSSVSIEDLEARLLLNILTAAAAAFDGDGSESSQVYSVGLQRLREGACVLMRDVRSDIASVGAVLGRFADFKKLYPEKYRNAYVSFSLPPLLGRLVEIDLLSLPLLEEKVFFKIYSLIL